MIRHNFIGHKFDCDGIFVTDIPRHNSLWQKIVTKNIRSQKICDAICDGNFDLWRKILSKLSSSIVGIQVWGRFWWAYCDGICYKLWRNSATVVIFVMKFRHNSVRTPKLTFLKIFLHFWFHCDLSYVAIRCKDKMMVIQQ